jgi:UDP-N-acetylglucosamine 4,6-dehydratase/5-epimerase
VPSCEFHPMEAVKTNVLGTENLLEAAIVNGVRKVVCLSSDKAVYPINAMGISKAMMEKVMVAKSRNIDPARTIFCATRYGNVIASRGSVVPLFVEQVFRGVPITVTDPMMTRFVMTLDEAVDLVLYAFTHGGSGDIFVHKAPAATLDTIARAVLAVIGKRHHAIKVIGTRHGEKLFETLLSREEMSSVEDLGRYYRIPPDLRDLNYRKFVEEGEPRISRQQDYNSHNAERLDIPALENTLRKVECIQGVLGDRVFSHEC